MTKINKNIIIGISIVAILLFTAVIGWLILQKKEPFVPKEIVEYEKTAEQLSQELTSPQAKPLTPKEQEELKKILKQSTSAQFKSLTEQERKDLEESLKQLTP